MHGTQGGRVAETMEPTIGRCRRSKTTCGRSSASTVKNPDAHDVPDDMVKILTKLKTWEREAVDCIDPEVTADKFNRLVLMLAGQVSVDTGSSEERTVDTVKGDRHWLIDDETFLCLYIHPGSREKDGVSIVCEATGEAARKDAWIRDSVRVSASSTKSTVDLHTTSSESRWLLP